MNEPSCPVGTGTPAGKMLTQLELLTKYAPALLLMSLVIGGVYNIGVVFGAGQLDFLYFLSYLDHINSALMSTGVFVLAIFIVYAFGLMLAPVASKMAARLRFDRFKVRVSARALAAFVLLFFVACDQAWRLGLTPRLFTGENTAFFFFVTAAVLAMKFFAYPEIQSAVLASLFAVWAALGLGLNWVHFAQQGEGPRLYIESDGRIVAKGVKAFSEFAIVVDEQNTIVVIRSKDIRKIIVSNEPPPGFEPAKAAPENKQ
jgi:hypothetical protein